MSAMAPVQVAIFDRLQTVEGFAVFVGMADREHGGDHLVIDTTTEVRRSTLGRRGHEGVETVHIWVKGKGRSLAAKQAATVVSAALEGEPLPVTGHETVACRRTEATQVLLQDAEWWHIPLRFRVHTMEAA
jgi:hypothetical protein